MKDNKSILQQLFMEVLFNGPFFNILSNIKSIINSVNDKYKVHFLSLIANQIDFDFLIKLGFNISSNSYYNARFYEGSLINNFDNLFNPISNSVVKLSNDVLRPYLLYLFEHSKSTQEVVKVNFNKRLDLSLYNEIGISYEDVFIYQLSKINLWRGFKELFPNLMSKRSFYRYFPHNLRPAIKETDKCDVCLVSDKLLIILADFKENFQIGGSLEEKSQDYYNKLLILLLSFRVYYNKGFGIQFKIFNIFSYVIAKDSQYIQQCMNVLFKLKFFEDSFDNIEFWSDCAGHFRSKYMLNYYKNRNKYNTFSFKFSLVNFYTEKHGKSVLDGYFGVLSRWLTDSERSTQITNIYMLVALFINKHRYNYNPNSLFKDVEHIIINYQIHNPFIYWEEMKDIQTYLSYGFNCLENKIYKCAFRSFNQSHYTQINSITKWKENPAYNNKDY
ncbi:hypothetical protein CONCODRAFT_14223 [Conidiobolus coronatus NRRL 28638]|uniref:Uncharacterized protein n=1 Tax=Conidiobolus coronatus (strain ATCC 28846 / CBS 209.66 / NRRL 28638) TaxID=796925 RepID=A0A137NPE6_CONC2|nr:hypothetical protein CONCODRAFT_14223 [Conidiobolus coronatus NRRL 28638]|eukprot:KXN64608.1 hypothetical protein CONCODRAFT_14223 [Conidiobolus coronatus NRRL 28638]